MKRAVVSLVMALLTLLGTQESNAAEQQGVRAAGQAVPATFPWDAGLVFGVSTPDEVRQRYGSPESTQTQGHVTTLKYSKYVGYKDYVEAKRVDPTTSPVPFSTVAEFGFVNGRLARISLTAPLLTVSDYTEDKWMMPFGRDRDFQLKYGRPFSTKPYRRELRGQRVDFKYEYFRASPDVLLRVRFMQDAPGRWMAILQDWIHMVDNKPLLPPED